VAPDERAERVSATLPSTFEQFAVGGPVHSSGAASRVRNRAPKIAARARKLVKFRLRAEKFPQKKASGPETFPPAAHLMR
jgi:ribosomal protein S30